MLNISDYEKEKVYEFKVTPMNKHGVGEPSTLTIKTSFFPGNIVNFRVA